MRFGYIDILRLDVVQQYILPYVKMRFRCCLYWWTQFLDDDHNIWGLYKCLANRFTLKCKLKIFHVYLPALSEGQCQFICDICLSVPSVCFDVRLSVCFVLCRPLLPILIINAVIDVGVNYSNENENILISSFLFRNILTPERSVRDDEFNEVDSQTLSS